MTVVCPTGKVRYRDRLKAERKMAHLIVHGSPKQVPSGAYRCDRCEGWHLTSNGFRAKPPKPALVAEAPVDVAVHCPPVADRRVRHYQRSRAAVTTAPRTTRKHGRNRR